LVHNITRSMPAPTPPQAVLAAVKAFAREKFGTRYHYAMALHTHQPHPHVNLVVKAEGIHGRRLRIDKAMLREWRQDFAQMMRDQGIAANATSRSARGQTKRAAKNVFYRTRRRKSRNLSHWDSL
jgi:Relaxase/Mobilisation nuclease domain